MCQRGLRAHVLICQHSLSPLPHTTGVTRDHLPTYIASSESPFDITFFCSTAIVVEAVHAAVEV